MPAQDPSHRRLVWLCRLVLYPLALGLIAVAWHQRHANADDGDGGVAPPREAVTAFLTGTAGADPAAAAVVDGRPVDLAFVLHYRCVPDLGDVWATYSGVPTEGGRWRVRLRDRETSWASGWLGEADIVVDGGPAGDGRVRGTVSARMALDADGVHALCRSGPRPLALDRIAGGPHGATSQQMPVQVALDGRGRPVALSVALVLWCDDVRTRRVVWATRLDGDGHASRRWAAIGRDDQILVGPGDAGVLSAWALRDGDRVRGGVVADVALDGGTRCRPSEDVGFSVATG